jgi:glutamyl/glutaminyl-tRNA synthetase
MPGDLIHPCRVAVTGKASSPGIFEVLELMGQENTRVRLDRMNRYLSKVKAAQAGTAA